MFEFLCDLIFPKRCVGCKNLGSYLCSNCFSTINFYQEFVCPMCLKRSIDGKTHPGCKMPFSLDGLIAGVVYKGVVKKLVYKFKYSPYLSRLDAIIGKIFIEGLIQNELFMHTLSLNPIVISVPLSSQKLRKRGYNQAEIIGNILAKEFKLKNFKNILIRKINTKPQFELDKARRAKNVRNAFEINLSLKPQIKNINVFLVDDLATSCATLKECAKVIKCAGAKRVFGVTFAREL